MTERPEPVADAPRSDAASNAVPRSVDRLPVVRTVLSLAVAACLVVPESEVRAKMFKANLILTNVKRIIH